MPKLSAIFLLLALGSRPAPVSVELASFLGEYGRGADRVIVLEAGGQLQAVVGKARAVAMSPSGKDRYTVLGKIWTFERQPQGKIEALQCGLNAPPLKRRADFPEDGGVFRIAPVRPVEELRKEALQLKPPQETGQFRNADLVDLTTLQAPIHLDIRYATTDNFMGRPMYSQARAFLQRPAAERLAMAALELKKQGFGLLIHDAYRPWYVTWMFWEATPPKQRIFVANPAEGSRHNRGCAVDLSMYEIATGKPVSMPSVYDEMTDRAFPDYPGGTGLQRWNRAVLREAMEKQGFEVFHTEWWHFDFHAWKQYAIGTVAFEKIR